MSDSEESDNHCLDSETEFTAAELIDACKAAGTTISAACHAVKTSVHLNPPPATNSTETVSNANIQIIEPEIPNPQSEYVGNIEAQRKRNKRPQPQNWEVTANRNKRMKGESFEIYGRTKNDKGKLQKVTRPARKIGVRCNSQLCKDRKSRHCNMFNEEIRNQIFQNFWQDLNWAEKKMQVISLVDRQQAKRKTKEGSARTETYHYYLKLDGRKREVCRTMFLNTLGLGQKQVRNWLMKPVAVRKVPAKYKTSSKKKDFACEFLDKLPKMPSHYCRKNSTKLYLEPLFSTQTQLYNAYQNECKSFGKKATSIKTFVGILTEKNISIYKPKKDWCDVCCSFEAGNLTEEEYQQHRKNAENARKERDIDKELALKSEVHALTMDVEAVKVSPVLNASALYYKTKLMVHNFTIYDMATRDVKCYLWDESEADLSASVFATCVINYLDSIKDGKPIFIFSDGCTNQNRNAMMSTALLHFAMQNKTVIIQKFLEKGHTQMEVDSVHSAIERKSKGKTIYVPTDYIQICKEARKDPRPYEVKYMHHQEFRDYTKQSNQRYSSIRPGTRVGEACVTDLRQLRYNIDGTIDYKLNFESDWISLPRSPKNVNFTNPPQLFQNRLPITKRKFQDLLDLLHVIPSNYHDFYKSLPHK